MLTLYSGVLLDAMRKGYWVILDELNLAPTDVLEALNRLLDDNRELFVAEMQEVIRAHPRFMLFATQNPPGLYGGRKVRHRMRTAVLISAPAVVLRNQHVPSRPSPRFPAESHGFFDLEVFDVFLTQTYSLMLMSSLCV